MSRRTLMLAFALSLEALTPGRTKRAIDHLRASRFTVIHAKEEKICVRNERPLRHVSL